MSFLTDEVAIGALAFGALILMLAIGFLLYTRPVVKIVIESIIIGIIAVVVIVNIVSKVIDITSFYGLVAELILFSVILGQDLIAFFRNRKWF